MIDVSVHDTIIKKLQQVTCDKTELNKQMLKLGKSLKEVRKVIEGTNQKKK